MRPALEQLMLLQLQHHQSVDYARRSESKERALLHSIETAIIDWTHQVRQVLKKESAQPLLEGLNPTPKVEVEFWRLREQNLDCIYEQLFSTKVKKLAELLEKSGSCYYPTFKELFTDVVAGNLVSSLLFISQALRNTKSN
jgi:dynein heavy chain